MGLHELIHEQNTSLACIGETCLREGVLYLSDLDLLSQLQVELVEHLTEGIR